MCLDELIFIDELGLRVLFFLKIALIIGVSANIIQRYLKWQLTK